MTADRSLRTGDVREAFPDWPLDRIMRWLREPAGREGGPDER